MINGFANETAPLTESELKALPAVVERLKLAVGKDRAVFNDQLRAITGLTSARIRKLINYIRCTGQVPCLLANSQGYYIAEKDSEILDYINSLEGREIAIREVRQSIEKQRVERWKNAQGSLF